MFAVHMKHNMQSCISSEEVYTTHAPPSVYCKLLLYLHKHLKYTNKKISLLHEWAVLHISTIQLIMPLLTTYFFIRFSQLPSLFCLEVS